MTPERIHDERMLELMRDVADAERKLGWAESALRSQSLGNRYLRTDSRTIDEVLVALEERKAEDIARWVDHQDAEGMMAYAARKYDEVVDKYSDAGIVCADAYNALRDHEKHYRGWQRFFLVTSSAGLVHRDMNCPTCNKGRQATTFALLPSLSGQTIGDLVAVLGPVLCSVCWPEAPVEWTDAVRIPTGIAVKLFEEGTEAFNAALADYRTKAAAKAAKVLADLNARGEATYSGAQYKLAEALVENGQATLVGRSGHSTWKGAWVKTITVKAAQS